MISQFQMFSFFLSLSLKKKNRLWLIVRELLSNYTMLCMFMHSQARNPPDQHTQKVNTYFCLLASADGLKDTKIVVTGETVI